MISCKEFLEEMSSYLDDEVAAGIRREVEAHLAECQTCQVLYDSTRKTLKVVTEVRSADLPGGLPDSMIARIISRIRAGGT